MLKIFGLTWCDENEPNEWPDIIRVRRDNCDESRTYNAEKTCEFEPEVPWSYYDENGTEIQTNEASLQGCDYICSCCGHMMSCGWFNETPGEHGGWNHVPRFSFCPYCGSEVVS